MGTIRNCRTIRQGQIRPQSGSHEKVPTEARAVPGVGRAPRCGDLLFVVEMDIVIFDVDQVVGAKIELTGDDVLADGPLNGNVGVSLEIALGVIAGEFHPIDLAMSIIEWRKNDRSAELAFVNEV